MSAGEPLMVLEDVSKVYRVGAQHVPALAGVSLTIGRGEAVAITGPSGSGKSTLLNILGCLDVPTGGRYLLNGEDVSRLGRNRLAAIRNRCFGFVFQNYNLIPQLTALENVALPLVYARRPPGERREAARAALAAVHLEERAHHRPLELSGGEQQRVAIARALVASPQVILADEPTGALDTATGRQIMDLLLTLNARGITLVVVTHEPEVAARCRRQVRMRDGRVVAA